MANKEAQNEFKLRKATWINGRDTGSSSKSLFFFLDLISENVEITTFNIPCSSFVNPYRVSFDIPYDSSDFGRCYRMLQSIPEFYESLNKIPKILPAWKPYIENWSSLERLYRQSKYDLLYEWLTELKDEAYVLDGWVKNGNSWSRN